ncbi:hypothetical protein LH51_09550 [Nitrincola sp. A-D6]|uniref:DUF3047 domain-containing protein n=1 Tax=Nitrincola sp. A-D6 TaxID=1545442 RepID=UPI00051FC56F|nr:DUF3047 domain-containing protein [Nitrincola sp. A-D6]KGK42154.1 hypothetical protein LH51_09550 [Nitrincola sp. A-D6]
MSTFAPKPLIPILTIGLLAVPLLASQQPPAFSQTGLHGWETESFKGQTDYQIVKAGDQPVLFAHARQSASGLGWEGELDVQSTPWLHWCWWVSTTYPGVDEASKAGDDYPARVYAVASTGFFRWQVQAINYVWASEQPQGTDWPNAYTSRARLLALQSGDERLHRWVAESRHLIDDFKIYFDNPDPQIQALALMTDADNTGLAARAWYSDLLLSASANHPGCPVAPPENR